jgi:transposase
MPNPRPPYPPEFRAEAVRPATAPGNTLTGTARDLGVSLESLRTWVRQADVDAGRRSGPSRCAPESARGSRPAAQRPGHDP